MLTAIGVTIALILLTLAGVIWAIVTRRGALRIVLPILGILFTGFLSLVLFVMFIINSIPRPTQFDSATYKGPMGKVSVPLTGDAELVCDQRSKHEGNGLLSLKVVNGTAIAPEGSYTLSSYSNTSTDSSGKSFDIQATLLKPIDFTVTKGSSRALKIGSPYVASVEPGETSPGKYVFRLVILGAAGEICTISDTSSKAKPAQFQIFSKTGQLLLTKKFEAG